MQSKYSLEILMRRLSLVLFVLVVNGYAQKGHLIPNPIRDIPAWVRIEFNTQGLNDHYSITYQMYPRFLKGDFNGDGKLDVALLVAERSTGKSGIAIVHGKQAQAFKHHIIILGAGKPLGSAGDDFKWMNLWSVLKNRKTLDAAEKSRLPELHGIAIRIQKREGGTGLIHWDGKKYEWTTLTR